MIFPNAKITGSALVARIAIHSPEDSRCATSFMDVVSTNFSTNRKAGFTFIVTFLPAVPTSGRLLFGRVVPIKERLLGDLGTSTVHHHLKGQSLRVGPRHDPYVLGVPFQNWRNLSWQQIPFRPVAQGFNVIRHLSHLRSLSRVPFSFVSLMTIL